MAASSDPNNVSTVSKEGQLAIRWFQSAAMGGRPLKKANALIARATPGRVHVTSRRAGGIDGGSATSILGRPHRRQVSVSNNGRSHPQSLAHAGCVLIATRHLIAAPASTTAGARMSAGRDHRPNENDRLSHGRPKLLGAP
jgi:hypothetical protein